MKKGAKKSFFIKHKKDLIYLGVFIIIVIIGIVIFMQLKQSSNEDNLNVQDQKYSKNIPENDGELDNPGTGGGSNIIPGGPAEESPGTGGGGTTPGEEIPPGEYNIPINRTNSSGGGASPGTPSITDNSTAKTQTPTNKIEICNDAIDNDGDNLKDCKDADCDEVKAGYSKEFGGYVYCNFKTEDNCYDKFDNDADGLIDVDDRDCISKKCDANFDYFVVWSYFPEEPLTGIPARRGCCPVKTCVNSDKKCIPYDTEYTTSAGNRYYICGDNNNWDRCGANIGSQVNKYEYDLSDGKGCSCLYFSKSSGYLWACGDD